jgi:DNA-binding NarL/FixJ family response regulator
MKETLSQKRRRAALSRKRPSGGRNGGGGGRMSDADVRSRLAEIRRLSAEGYTHGRIAAELGLTPSGLTRFIQRHPG